jgi:hypothetical protein
MTVPTTAAIWGPYYGNDVTNTFPFTGKLFAKEHLIVTKELLATAGRVNLVLGLHYDVAINSNENGGNVVMFLPLASGYSLMIRRIIPLTQLTDIKNQGAFHAEIHEAVFDYLTMVDQQLKANQPIFDPAVALQFLRWKSPATLNEIESVGISSIADLTATLSLSRIPFATGPTS